MAKKYTPAVFQPTVRPSWAGALSYISAEEKSAILEAIVRYPETTNIKSIFWEDTILPDLEAQYNKFKNTCSARGQVARAYWGEQLLSKCYTKGNQQVTNTKDKDKDKDKDNINNINNINLKKEKNKKEKKVFSFDGSPLADVMRLWLDYRKEIKRPLRGDMAIEQCYKKLQALSDGDVALAEQVVNQSISNGWQGLFAVQNTKTKNTTVGFTPYRNHGGNDVFPESEEF